MSQLQSEIVKQTPTHPGMQVAADDRWLSRWVFDMGAPISLAEYSGSRFVGKFDNDVLPAKKPIVFAPHMARSTGVYEHRAQAGDLASMGASIVDEMLTVPINAPQIGAVDRTYQAPLSQYDNNPKLCAYLLMRDYERRGLVLFEDLRGLSDDEFSFIYDLILPPEVRAGWAKTERIVLDHKFNGPFLDQYREWFGPEFRAGLVKRSEIAFPVPGSLNRKLRNQISFMARELRAGANRAWSYENSVLNTTEQQIRRYRNGHRGKEFYDMPDERFDNPIPPLDLQCLADTGRQPIDLQQAEAVTEGSKATAEAMVEGMKTFAAEMASQMKPALTAADIDAMLEARLKERDREWEARIVELKGVSEPSAN